MRLRRRDLLRGATALAAGGTATVGVDGFYLTPKSLEVSRHRLGGPSGGSGALAAEAAGDGSRLLIAHVSDLHLRSIGSLEIGLLEALERLRPDLILLTGDSIDAATGTGLLGEFLAACPAAPHKFAILGNWEYRSGVPVERLVDLHARHDFDLLVNRSVTFPIGGRSVRVTGLDDLLHGRPDARAAVASGSPCDRHLVLAHCPTLRDRLGLPAEHGADLVLSGHTHGGQVAPCGMALVLPAGSGRYVKGWYHDDAPPLFVSRGIGTSTFPVRLGSSPELACIEWRLD